jgi:hypothetical protein
VQRISTIIGSLITLCILSGCVQDSPPTQAIPAIAVPTTLTAKITFSNALQAGFAEQDVFVPVRHSNQQVHRMARTLDAHNMDVLMNVSLRTTSQPVKHDFSGNPQTGPFPAGPSLHLQTKRWLNILGNGTYSTNQGQAKLVATVDHLLKRGTYSLWCAEQGLGSGKTLLERPCALGAMVPNQFQADGTGYLELEATLPALADTSASNISMLWLVYHSNRNSDPAQVQFGVNAHIHAIAKIPSPAAVQPIY